MAKDKTAPMQVFDGIRTYTYSTQGNEKEKYSWGGDSYEWLLLTLSRGGQVNSKKEAFRGASS